MWLDMKILKILRDVDASVKEISDILMVQPETVSRVLYRLYKKNILNIKVLEGNKIVFTYH